MAASGGTSARLAGGRGGPAGLRPLLHTALDALGRGANDRGGPAPGAHPETGTSDRAAGAVAANLSEAFGGELLPRRGTGAQQALGSLARAFAAGAVDPADPSCAAHLHCPPLAVAVVADLVASALNSSLDSYDQGPSAAALELEVVRAVAGLIGFDPAEAAGTLTSGGTESNHTALLLARDHAVRRVVGMEGADAATAGLSAAGVPLRVFCSSAAHFSIARTAGFLGIGEDSVTALPADADHRMDPRRLHEVLARAARRGEAPVVVATAGTTDLGAIDPLPEIADAAVAYGAWLHVDAAYGGAVLASERLAHLLTGIARADSVALDLHKLGWQPVAAGLLITRREDAFDPLARRVAYLNPDDDEEAGYPSLLGRSLRTTRRPDAFKIAVTLRALGRDGLGALVDRCHELARYAAARVTERPDLDLYNEPVLTTVLFRYVPEAGTEDAAGRDRVNAALRRVLLAEGRAVVGRTEADGAVWLKLTLLNPHTTESDIDRLLAAVAAAGEKEVR